MKRTKKLIILFAVLAVFVCGYFVVKHFVADSGSNSESIEISSTDSDKIESIRWVYGKNDIEIKPGDNNKWYYVGDKDFPLDSEKAADILSSVSKVTAVKKVSEHPDNLATYGIDDPAIKIYVTADNTTHEYDIGDYNEASGYYYMMHSNDTTLYYVDSSMYTLFAVSLLDLAENETLPEIETADVSVITLESDGKKYNIKPDNGEYYVDDSTGATVKCDSSIVTSLITNFTNVSWTSCAAYNVTADDLEAYGLDEPQAVFEIQYTYLVESESVSTNGEASSTAINGDDSLLIGNAYGENGDLYYAMIRGGKCVYTLSADTAESYIISSAEDLLSKKVTDFVASDIDTISVNFRDVSYDFKAVTDEEAETTSYTYNGVTAELADFVTALQSLEADTVNNSGITGYGDKRIAIVVKDKDGTSSEIIIYKYDDDYCAVSVDGVVKYLVDEGDCNDVYDEFRTIVSTLSDESTT